MTPRRRELLKIAADLFAERGFANVTVDDIGEAAGVSGPALYHHFPGKDALLGEMLVGISQYLLDGGRHVIDTAVDGVDHLGDGVDHLGDAGVLERLVRFHAAFAVDDRSLITVHFRDLVHTLPDDHDQVRTLQSEYVALWAEALRKRQPDLSPEQATAAVHATFGLINSTPFSGRLPRDEMIEILSRMALAALAAALRT